MPRRGHVGVPRLSSSRAMHPFSATVHAIQFLRLNKWDTSRGPSLLPGLPVAPPLFEELQGEKRCPERLTGSRPTTFAVRFCFRARCKPEFILRLDRS